MEKIPGKYSPEEAFREGMAIQHISDATAEKEGLSGPDKEHYEMFSKMLDDTRKILPEITEAMIDVAADAQALKHELGKEKFDIFRKVMEEVTHKIKDKIEATKIKMIAKSFDATPDDKQFDPESFVKEFIKKMLDEAFEKTFSDERVREVFAGRQDLLERSKQLYYEQAIRLSEKMIGVKL